MDSKTIIRNPKDFGDSLLSLKNRKKLCDAALIVNGERIPVHANVLASSCEYFQNQFVNAESPIMEETFIDYGTNSFKLVIDYFYKGSIEITEKNVKEIAKIANYFVIPVIIDGSSKFLEKKLNNINCLSVWKFAQSEHIDNLKKASFEYISDHFEIISQCEEFLKLEYFQIQELLSSDVKGVSEMVIYDSVKRWVNHDIEQRTENTANLLDLIKLSCLPPNFLLSELDTLCNDVKCFKKITAATKENRGICFSDRTVLVVGASESERAKSIEIYDSIKKEWVEINGLDVDRYTFATTLLRDKLIMIGGYTDSKSVDTVCIYQVSSVNLKTWKIEKLPPLNHRRHRLTVVQWRGNIYAIGGEEDTTRVSYCEKWEPQSEQWQVVSSLNSVRNWFCAKVVGDEIFAIGGGTTTEYLNSVEAFNPFTNTWNYRMPMHVKRQAPGAAVIGTYIYVAGGRNETFLNSAEKYDTKNDNWTMIQSMNFPRAYLEAGYLMGKLIFTGGFKDGETFSTVEVYDPENNKWANLPPLKKVRCEHNVIEIPLSLAKQIITKNSWV